MKVEGTHQRDNDMAIKILQAWRQSFTPTVWTLLPVGVAINLGVGLIAQTVKAPVYLDSIGTVMVAILSGPAPAIMTAVLTVTVGGLTINPVLPWFVGTAVAIGWFSGSVANRGAFGKAWSSAACGIAQGAICAVVSAPVIVALFGGITQSGSSLVVAFLMATGETVLNSVILAGLACDPLDKMLTYLIAFALLKGIPDSLLAHFPRGLANIGSTVSGVVKIDV